MWINTVWEKTHKMECYEWVESKNQNKNDNKKHPTKGSNSIPTPGILSQDGSIRREKFALAFRVDGCHTELVLVARRQVRDVNLQVIRFAHLFPFAFLLVALLDNVVGDGGATILFGCVPQEGAAVRVNIHDIQWTLGRAGGPCVHETKPSAFVLFFFPVSVYVSGK